MNTDDPAHSRVTVTQPPSCLAIVGAGVMGSGIAAAGLAAGLRVILIDSSAESLEKGAATAREESIRLAGSMIGGRQDHAGRVGELLRPSVNLEDAASADVVIESIVERIDVKHELFRALDRITRPEAVLATNTSTYPIRRIAEPVSDASRICGMHFFVPVERRHLVEVIRGKDTSDRATSTAVALSNRIGKRAVVVRDSPGFLVNRVLMPYLNEAVEMLREGVPTERIDAAARSFGMPVGPLELYDMIGLDTALYAGMVMHDAFGDRIEASPVVPALVRAKMLGRKAGVGFYHHEDGQHGPESGFGPPNEAVSSILDRYPSEPHRSGDAGVRDRYPEALINDRLFLPMVIEAELALEEGVIGHADDVDLAVAYGLGFPPSKGGLMQWAASLGEGELQMRLTSLASLGPRMCPPSGLIARVCGRAGSRS